MEAMTSWRIAVILATARSTGAQLQARGTSQA
jgi:hypothetical protein